MSNTKTRQTQYTPEQQEQISKVWLQEPPHECTGKCKLNTASCLGILFCDGCGWNDEDHTPCP